MPDLSAYRHFRFGMLVTGELRTVYARIEHGKCAAKQEGAF